jgi:hypothetical protein
VLYLALASGAKIRSMKILKSATIPPVERLRFVRQLRESNPKADPVALAAVEAAALKEIEADNIRLAALGVRWE